MKPGEKYLDPQGRTIAVYPSPFLAWSQDVNTGSHLGSFAFDETVDGTRTKKPIYSPGNLIVVAKQAEGKSNAIILDTLAPEHWADGTIDFYHLRLVHDDNISDIALKQIFTQGEKLYDEGVYGRVTGPHIHLEVGRGKYPGRLVLNKAGNNALIKSVEPWKVFFVNDTTILNGFGHPWKTYVWPAVPVLKYKAGQKIVLNGRVYRNSLLGGPGAIFTNRVGFIRFLINDEIVPAPYHIDGLGWVKEESLTLAPITIEIPKIRVGDKVKISGTHYATGEKVPFWGKLRVHTVAAITGSRARLKEINSWVNLKDLKKG